VKASLGYVSAKRSLINVMSPSTCASVALMLSPRQAAVVCCPLCGITRPSALRQAVQKRIAAMPRHWIPAAQTFRLGVEWVLHLEHVRGRAPVQVGIRVRVGPRVGSSVTRGDDACVLMGFPTQTLPVA